MKIIRSIQSHPLWWLGGAISVGWLLTDNKSTSNFSQLDKIKFTDPENYFNQIQVQSKSIQNIKDNRNAENDARVKEWKKTAGLIPIIGDFAGIFFDLGNWLGKKLGSNYADQNSPEDLKASADGIVQWLSLGFVPPKPLFNEKDGAKFYSQYLFSTLEEIKKLSSINSKALTTMGILTIANSNNSNMKLGVLEASNGNGSLKSAGWYGSPAKLVGAESIIAGIVSSQYNMSFTEAKNFALKLHIPGSDLNGIADQFIATMRMASK